MSRIGRKAVTIPAGVSVTLGEGEIRVKGPKGQLAGALPAAISAQVADGEVSFSRTEDHKTIRSLHGLVRALTQSMIVGVTEGFRKGLEIEGVGYRAELKGKKLVLTLGYSHPIEMAVPDGLSVKLASNTSLSIEGIDKRAVGQFAADIRALRPPEPYKGKGIRYAGERIRRKVGKTGA